MSTSGRRSLFPWARLRTPRAVAIHLAVLLAAACGGGGPKESLVKTPTAPGGSKDPSKWPADDRSMCDWRNKPELEVSETIGPGAIKPNVRRVYRIVGEGDARHKTLACREIDTNLDGIKDVVRTFNQRGEALHEEADRDYDGKIDVWINFVDGRIAQEDIDTNRDGKPDVWKFYVNGQLQRVRRDRNGDGKPDVWEFYSKGRLERIGVDETYDGHVDRWDRDEQLKYEADNAERKAQEPSGPETKSSAPPPSPRLSGNNASGSGDSDAGAAKPEEKGSPPADKSSTPAEKK
jgi:hypothetical protein